jgi:mycothiol synthase
VRRVIVTHPTVDRLPEALALLQASDAAIWGDSDWTEADLREDWERIDLRHDAWLVELDGRLAGVAQLLDRKGGRFIGDAYVHPEMTGRGVGRRVLGLLEARSRELEPDWPDGERVVLQGAHLVGDDRAPELFRTQGFEYVRSFFRMVVDVREPHPAPEWPEGLELRPFDVARHGRAVHAAQEEAFAREWGHVAQPYEAWRERAFVIPRIDPSLVPVVWHGDEVAACSLNYAKRNGNWGWVGMLGVREPWRRRGLGLALLRESFRRFRETGETTVALGVDADNPTGATRLYERAGMRPLWQADVWEKELRPAPTEAQPRSARIAG